MDSKIKEVEVSVWAEVSVSVACDDCGEQLEIAQLEAGEKYHPGHIYVVIKPHKCEVL